MLNRRPERATNAMKDPGVPHPRHDQPSPCHFGRRPRSTQLAQAPATKTKDLCSAIPVHPGPVRETPLSPCVSHTEDRGNPPHGVVLPPHLPGDGKSPEQDSLSTPPSKATHIHICIYIYIYIYIYMTPARDPKQLVIEITWALESL